MNEGILKEEGNLRVRLVHDEDAEDPRKAWDFWREEDVIAYENGDVYGYLIERKIDDEIGWESIDSLFGLYGYGYAEETAIDAFNGALVAAGKD